MSRILYLQVNVHKLPADKFNRKPEAAGPLDLYIQAQNHASKNLYESSDPRQLLFERDIMDLIAIAGCPLELVEHPAFVNTIKHLDRKIHTVSRRTVGRRLEKAVLKVNE